MFFLAFYTFKTASGILTSALTETDGMKKFSSGSGGMMPLHQMDKCALFLWRRLVIPLRLFLLPVMEGGTWRTDSHVRVLLHGL